MVHGPVTEVSSCISLEVKLDVMTIDLSDFSLAIFWHLCIFGLYGTIQMLFLLLLFSCMGNKNVSNLSRLNYFKMNYGPFITLSL